LIRLHNALAQKATQGIYHAFPAGSGQLGSLSFNKVGEALHTGGIKAIDLQLFAHSISGGTKGG
jgi:hypothetical protein